MMAVRWRLIGTISLRPAPFWVACDFDQIHRTLVGGEVWLSQSTAGIGPSNQYLVGIDALNMHTALVTGQDASGNPIYKKGKILKTSDGGNTWVLKDIPKSDLYKVAYIH